MSVRNRGSAGQAGERRLEAVAAPQERAVDLDSWTATIAARYGRRDYLLRRVLAATDALGILAAAVLAFELSPVRSGSGDIVWLLPTLPVWLFLFRAYGLYEGDVKRIGISVLDDLPGLFHAFLIGTLALWAYFRVLPVHRMVLMEVFVFGAVGLVGIGLLRTGARRILSHGFGPERVLILGRAPLIDMLAAKMRRHAEYGLEPIGAVLAGPNESRPESTRTLATIDDLDLEATVIDHAIDRLIVVQSEVGEEQMLSLAQECGRLQVKVSILPSYVNAMGPSLQIDDVEGVVVFNLNPLVLSRSSRMLKRLMDLVGASVLLLLSAPVLAIAALAIKLDSRGPVFFRQERIGRGGRCFRVLKFRTMAPDAEGQLAALRERSADPNWLLIENDPRITRVGSVLRHASIDELPQLWNVLRGDMSLVGPRPLSALEDERIEHWARARIDLSPGMTGLWQVLGRTRIPFEEMAKLDYVYVSNWSLWLDVQLLLRTVPAVLRRRGVN